MVEERPWGYFTILEEKETHKVKRIVVYPGNRLSYQSHEKRSELWVIVRGEGLITLNDMPIQVREGSMMKIPAFAKHRIQNTGDTQLEFIEIQTGTYFGEDDIVRYSDDYGRSI